MTGFGKVGSEIAKRAKGAGTSVARGVVIREDAVVRTLDSGLVARLCITT